MNKWYRPLGFLLLAAMVGETSGCAQTSGWLAKKTSKKSADESIADAKATARGKDKKAKSSKELADMKSDASTSALADTKAKPKSGDTEQAKYTDEGEQPSKSKSRVDPLAEEERSSVIASTKPVTSKLNSANRKTDDDLDSFLSDIETSPNTLRKDVAKKAASDEFASSNDSVDQVKKHVVQVKKEVAKDVESVEEDIADWAAEPSSDAKSVKTANATTSESSVDEPKTSSTASAARKIAGKQSDLTDVSSDLSFDSLKKSAISKVAGSGLLTLCPTADAELTSLLKGLDPADPESLKQGLQQIGQMRTKGVAAAPMLQKMLKHEDAFVRTHAALAMSRLKLTSPESIKVVTESLKSRDASLRSFGTAVLGEMGPQSNQVLTSLSENLNDKDGQVRLRAAEVLIRHDGFSYPALQCLLTSLKDKDDNVRWLATYSLAELAPESPEAVQGLLKACHDPVPKVRVGAVYALGEIGPFAKRSCDELRGLLETSKDEELKSAITSALQQIDK